MPAKLLKGPVDKTLIDLTGPMIIGIVAILAFNLIDTYFIGQLGTQPLAAISFTFPVVTFLGNIAMGLGIGASSVISRAIGEGADERVKRLTTDALSMSMLIVAVIAVLGLATIDPVFRLLGATDETLPLIREYMEIWYVGVVFLVIPMVGDSAIRASGDTRTPAAIMIVAAIANAILDPLLIFGLGPIPAMGLRGAALATVLGRAITLVFTMVILVRREKMIALANMTWATVIASWRSIIAVGAPAAATQVIVPVSVAIVTARVADFGDASVAAFGAGSRVEALALIIPLALSAALSPFMGQNWGGERFDRVREAIRLSNRFVLTWGIAAWALLALFASPIAGVFSDDPDVIADLSRYFYLVPLGYGLQCVVFMASSTFNAINRPLRATALVGLRMFAFFVPFAYLGAYLGGLNGLFIGLGLGNALGGVVGWLWLAQLTRETQSTPTTSPA